MAGLFDTLGVKTFINARGTVTAFGGSLMDARVLAAAADAARCFVELDELQTKAGKYIARRLGVEAAFITCGAAAGIVLSTAAVIAGTDPEKMRKLPNCDDCAADIIVLKAHMCQYEQQIRQGGGRIVTVGNGESLSVAWLQRAFNEHTAAVFYFAESQDVPGSLPLAEVIEAAKPMGIPVLVDAAAELPPRDNLRSFLDEGADLVQCSGGKDLRGPQSSGLVLGRSDLIAACRKNSVPNAGIGRALKVDKETIAALTAAVDIYLEEDEAARMRHYHKVVDAMAAELSELPGVSLRPGEGISPGIQPRCIPRLYVTWDRKIVDRTREQIVAGLKHGEPGIIVSTMSEDGLEINPHTLQEGEEWIVVQRLREVFSQQD